MADIEPHGSDEQKQGAPREVEEQAGSAGPFLLGFLFVLGLVILDGALAK